EHGDHACGAFDFAAAHGATVYLTHGTLGALGAEGKVIEGVKTVILEKKSLTIDGMEVIPFTVPHDAREPVQFVLSDGAARLGVLTDIGSPTAHVEQSLSGCDALVLECNYDLDMLWSGAYPRWLKERIAVPSLRPVSAEPQRDGRSWRARRGSAPSFPRPPSRLRGWRGAWTGNRCRRCCRHRGG